MIIPRHRPIVMRAHHVIPARLSLQVKLSALNALLQTTRKPLVNTLPPPQIVLTPTQPCWGRCGFILQGGWFSQPPAVVTLSGNNQDSIQFSLSGLAQGTFLFDVSVDSAASTAAWSYYPDIGAGGTLTPQQGHLLYPFISQGINISIWPPNDGGFHVWNSTELTQVA